MYGAQCKLKLIVRNVISFELKLSQSRMHHDKLIESDYEVLGHVVSKDLAYMNFLIASIAPATVLELPNTKQLSSSATTKEPGLETSSVAVKTTTPTNFKVE